MFEHFLPDFIFDKFDDVTPAFLAEQGIGFLLIDIDNTLEGAVINSVISANVTVEKGAVVKDSVIMQGTTVKANAKVLYSIIDEEATVGEGASVGADKEAAKEVTVLGMGAELPAGATVEEGKILSAEDVKGGNK